MSLQLCLLKIISTSSSQSIFHRSRRCHHLSGNLQLETLIGGSLCFVACIPRVTIIPVPQLRLNVKCTDVDQQRSVKIACPRVPLTVMGFEIVYLLCGKHNAKERT